MEPSKMTVGQWLDVWLVEYTKGLKPYSLRNYKSQVKNHIKPYVGAVKIAEMAPDMIQRMYNMLAGECELSPKTIRNIHGILHSAFETLLDIEEIRINPCTACAKRLPKVVKKELHPLADKDLECFIKTIKGMPYENLFLVDLFTGLRQGELLGLRWSRVDFEKGCVTIDKQLYMPEKGGSYTLQPLKNRKARLICPAPFVFDVLKCERKNQLAARLKAGEVWNTEGLPDLVFTNELGGHLSHKTVYKQFKAAVAKSGVPDVRFHDMRHSYAVASLRSGDDVKTVQENLGHATAAFTLDQYAFVTEKMKRESAQRMENYIASIVEK
jgi:integrase